MIYLDNAATTPLDRRVLESMMPYLTTQYGNAGTLYKFGRAANEAIQNARAQVSRFVGASNDSIIFTSGGSESNNLVFRGVKEYLKRIGRTHILVSAVEHDSVLRAAGSLIKDGFDVGYIPVQGDGSVSLTAMEGLLRPDTGLVSVMYVNNETGAVNPVCDIGSLCMKHGVLFHTDCVQAAGCHAIDAVEIGCDFLSVSSHKIHGPKGVGALYVKDMTTITPLIYGGTEQEYESCVEAAARLLGGERLINDISVVFQSNHRQGSGTYLELYDSYLGYTYLCYSEHPEYYENQ